MSMSDDVVIVSAARTPVGSFNGAFATTPAHDLGAIAIKAALERAGIEPGRVSEVIMGQILTAAQGQNPARQASIAAGIPVESPAWGVNQLCGSGLRTVALGYQALLNGDSEIVVAGGQESMSMAPHAQYLRGGTKMGPIEFIDTMIKDGLWDAFNGYHMGNTAENVARQYQITRSQQDEFAVASQNKADPGLPRRTEEGRLEHRRPRSGRGQRGLCRAGLCGQQGPRLGYVEGQRQWRRDRDRSPGWCIRRARAGDAAARDAEARCQE